MIYTATYFDISMSISRGRYRVNPT